MKEAMYFNGQTVLINFTTQYSSTVDEVFSGHNFKRFLTAYLNELKEVNQSLYNWVTQEQTNESMIVEELVYLCKLISVLEVKEIKHRLLENRERLLLVVEDAYSFWRKLQRCTFIQSRAKSGLQVANFLESDTEFNQLIRTVYRSIQEKLQGQKNLIYRQLQAGSNASMVLREFSWKIPKGYENLKAISFVQSVMLRTPLLLQTKSNKRVGTFEETSENPVYSFKGNKEEWVCIPCKAGSLLAFVYVHRDFIFTGLGLANLFEFASESEWSIKKPDLIVLFGNQDEKEECTFFHDLEQDIWVGSVSYTDIIEYFGYLKKMILTLHNLAMLEKGWLPVHGAMIQVEFIEGSKQGVVLIGDSGAGKSETIEALQKLRKKKINSFKIIFDDMGSLHRDNQLYAQGTEIGAFIRLDDLDKGSAYRDMDRSIFFNPETSNARVIIPVTPYQEIIKDHKVDIILYANNYEDKEGIREINSVQEACEVFIEGKRFAIGTTQEKGISKTYFANPFGPMQKQELTTPLIIELFKYGKENNIFIGELYTCLGIDDKKDFGLEKAAEALYVLLEKKREGSL